MRNTKARWIVVLSVIVAVILIVVIRQKPEAIAEQSGPPQAMGVDVVVLSPSTGETTISLPGTIQADESVEVRPEVSGKVSSIAFKEGERVNKGDLLITIDQPELRAQMERVSEEIKLASSEAKRREELLALGGISKEEYEQSYTRLKSLEADRQGLSAELAKGQVRAPFSGITGLREVSPGSFVSPETIITSIRQLNELKVEFKVPERYVASVKNGKPVTLITGEGLEVPAEVYASAGGIDPATRTLSVKAVTKNSSLVPGSFVEVTLPVASGTSGLAIPTEALMPEIDGNKVFVKKGGKAVKVKVETGRRGPYEIELTGGVSPGDTVIISGLLVLREGAAVVAKK